MQMCAWQSTSLLPGSTALLAFPLPPIHHASSPRPVATVQVSPSPLILGEESKTESNLGHLHAPYKLKHRYWTRLLLLVCCALFLVFAFNISGDHSVNLLVIFPTAFGILVWFALSGVVYKSWCLNALEVSFFFNLGMLAAATIYVKLSSGSQAAVACTSVGITFLSFLGIVTYHIYM